MAQEQRRWIRKTVCERRSLNCVSAKFIMRPLGALKWEQWPITAKKVFYWEYADMPPQGGWRGSRVAVAQTTLCWSGCVCVCVCKTCLHVLSMSDSKWKALFLLLNYLLLELSLLTLKVGQSIIYMGQAVWAEPSRAGPNWAVQAEPKQARPS